jgi:hypothetical protein
MFRALSSNTAGELGGVVVLARRFLSASSFQQARCIPPSCICSALPGMAEAPRAGHGHSARNTTHLSGSGVYLLILVILSVFPLFLSSSSPHNRHSSRLFNFLHTKSALFVQQSCSATMSVELLFAIWNATFQALSGLDALVNLFPFLVKCFLFFWRLPRRFWQWFWFDPVEPLPETPAEEQLRLLREISTSARNTELLRALCTDRNIEVPDLTPPGPRQSEPQGEI